MSQHFYETSNAEGKRLTVLMGYDRPLDFVFCTVTDQNGEVLYCNLDDPEAGTDQQDVNYYRPVLRRLGLSIPEAMYQEISLDQILRIGTRQRIHGDE